MRLEWLDGNGSVFAKAKVQIAGGKVCVVQLPKSAGPTGLIPPEAARIGWNFGAGSGSHINENE